jgi:hypothetical protein
MFETVTTPQKQLILYKQTKIKILMDMIVIIIVSNNEINKTVNNNSTFLKVATTTISAKKSRLPAVRSSS